MPTDTRSQVRLSFGYYGIYSNPFGNPAGPNHENTCKVPRTRHPKPETHNTKIALRGAKNVPQGSKMEPKWTKMEPLRVPGGAFWTPWAALGAPWTPLGAPLGPPWGPGWFLHRFWSIFGSILGAKMVPKSDKKQGCFPCHILEPFLKDFELFLERILDTFRQFQPKIEKLVKMCI